MKKHISLVVLASLTMAWAGCSKHSQTASLPKSNDLGVIDVSSGKPSNHTLADGRACTITPTMLPDGNVSLITSLVETNGSTTRSRTLTFEAPADGRAYTFGFDKSTVLTVSLVGKDAILPGRHMSESQVGEIVGRELPQTSGFRCEFKDGVWEILEVQKDVWGVSSRITNADGKITVHSTNATREVLRVRDVDGKVEP